MSEFNIELGAKVRNLRHQKGFSQSELGEYLGVTFQQIQKYENGLNRISCSSLVKIAEFLGVDIGYFFEQKEPIELDKKDHAILRALSKIDCPKKKKFIRLLIRVISTWDD